MDIVDADLVLVLVDFVVVVMLDASWLGTKVLIHLIPFLHSVCPDQLFVHSPW